MLRSGLHLVCLLPLLLNQSLWEVGGGPQRAPCPLHSMNAQNSALLLAAALCVVEKS